MSDFEKVRVRSYRFERYAWVLIVIWTVVAATSLGWNVIQIQHDILKTARIHARAAHEKDIIYRRWNTGHGGVYVPVTEITQPNPYLTDIHKRDITTQLDKRLTLMNPAYMTRQVHELAEEEYGVLGHITSLNPIRPENASDPWETEALHAFERGEIEISSLEEMKGKEYMRLMRPLITERGCLICHAAQGYQEGDIRGGISVSIPMELLKAIARINVLVLAVGHILLWLMGMGGIVLGTRKLRRSERERKKAEEELRESEELFRCLSDAAFEAIAIHERGKILRANNQYFEMFGYEPEELLGKQVFSLTVAPEAREPVKKQVATGGLGPYKSIGLRKDGTKFPVEIRIREMEYEGRKVRVGAVMDITERKKAEEKLKEYSKRLEEMVEERTRELNEAQNQLLRKERLAILGSLAGGVAHELRNPLGVISNAVYYLKTVLSDTDKTTRESLDSVSSEIRNAEKIISDLLDFSRITPAEREEVEVSALVKQVLDRKPAPKKIKVSVEIAPSLPCLHVDRQQIVLVLDNLVLNAYQAMPEGGRLIIQAKTVKDKMFLTLTDTGCGISRENRDKIFDPLFTTKARGLGLGLSVSMRFVEVNGGKITVKSEKGKGSTFTLALPVKESGE